MNFWIIIDQRHAGPFSLEQLREQGITPDRLVWHDGLTDWTPARDIPALAELFTAAEPESGSEPCPPAPSVEEATAHPAPAAPQEPPRQQWQQQSPGQQQWQQPRGGQPDFGAPRQQYAPGQPPYNGGNVPPCPPTYLVWAVITTICCCTPAGIAAIIYAANIKNAYYRGDYLKAERNSSRAQAWIIASIVLGLLSVPMQMAYYGVFDMIDMLELF